MNKVRGLAFCLATVLLVGCGGGDSGGSSSGGAASSKLVQDIGRFIPHPEDRAFFASEAARVGVTTVRRPRAGDDFGDVDVRNTCGYYAPSNEPTAILIVYTGPGCVDIYTLIAHEIAHFGVDRICKDGHGEPFWAYFRGIAARYVNQIPNGRWERPFNTIAAEERIYANTGRRKC